MAPKTALSLVAAVGAVASLMLLPFAVAPHGPSPRGLGLDAALTSLFLTLLAVAFAARSPEPLAQRLGLGPGRLSAPRTALLVVGVVGLSQALDGAIHFAGLDRDGALASLDAIVRGARGGDLALMLFGGAVCAGVGEEVFARGWIQRGLSRRFGAAVGLLVASSLFGALHLDPVHTPAAFALGLYLGLLTEATGAIRAGMLAHVLNNAVAFATTAFGIEVSDDVAGVGLSFAGAALAVLGLVAARPGLAVAAPAPVVPAPEP